ncbi:MAG: DNA repair protein RecO [Patescibacteria group bacterium]
MEFRTAGFVLKKQSFGEADRILRIFSREFGLLSALAKGVKKTKSRKAGCLELFCETNFRLHRKTGELFLVTETAPLSSFSSSDLQFLKPAFEAAELLLALAPPEKPLPKIYKNFHDFLEILPATSKPRLLKIAFFTKVLSIFGFLPDFEQFEKRDKKFFKFLLRESFPQILKLEEEEAIFKKTEDYLREILENVTEKTSRVVSATRDWS